jgi:hypothetical protein
MADPFDLNNLRADPADPSLRPKGTTTRRKAGWQKQFIRFPWSWMDRLRATNRSVTYRLALLLVYEHWRTAVGLLCCRIQPQSGRAYPPGRNGMHYASLSKWG